MSEKLADRKVRLSIRDEAIIAQRKAGMHLHLIAERHGCTRSRVWQIVKKRQLIETRQPSKPGEVR